MEDILAPADLPTRPAYQTAVHSPNFVPLPVKMQARSAPSLPRLATATGTTANVVTPILAKTGVLPLSSATIAQLLAQNSGVDPSQFPALIQAFTTVAKAGALFTALKPTESEFAFAVQNAATFNWLDPGALPLAPSPSSPYVLFETLLRAFKLNKRLSSRTPKLFDILAQWLSSAALPTDLPTAIGGSTVAVTAASNTSPISITTAAPHGLSTGMQVAIGGALGNVAANGTFSVTVTSATSFTLDGSTGNGIWTGGGTVALPSLAQALNASANDVLAIATALVATPPGMTAATQPGSLADMSMLSAIAAGLDVAERYSMSGPTLVQLSTVPATTDTAAAAMGVLQAQYVPSAWLAAITPVQDTLRQQRRDALVAYLLGAGPAVPAVPLLSVDDIFDYYLIDPEMSPCAPMTRLLQASLAIQQFVQQCFLNLFFASVSVDMSSPLWEEWLWRQQYRLWQANREVFLYPENYVLPELLPKPSSFFTDLQSDMRQSNCDAAAAQAALENYLRKLLSVARLKVTAHYNELQADGTYVLHVFAQTRTAPAQWYYRQRAGSAPGTGSWSPWQSLNLDISGPQLIPVIWDQRLHLLWPTFKQLSEKQTDQSVPGSTGGGTQPAPQQIWSIEFSMSEFSAGQWQAKRTVAEKMYIDKTTNILDAVVIDRPPLAFTFQASQDAKFNLNIATFYTMTPDELILAGFFGGDWRANPQIGSATLSMPEAPMAIRESRLIPDPNLIDLSQEPSYPLVVTTSLPASLTTPALYSYSGEDMVAGNWSGQVFVQQTGNTKLYVLARPGPQAQPVSVELLGQITNPRIVVPQQEPVFDSADPFFVTDATRSYLVRPEYFTVSSNPQELTGATYAKQWATRYDFETFYHPYARTFLRELEIGGVSNLMRRNLQVNPEAVRGWTPIFNFGAVYQPQPPVIQPYPDRPTRSTQGRARWTSQPVRLAPTRYTTGSFSITHRCSSLRCSFRTSNFRTH